MIDLHDYLVNLRDAAGCREISISLDSHFNAVFMTLRYEDGTRRFCFADAMVNEKVDLLAEAVGLAKRERSELLEDR